MYIPLCRECFNYSHKMQEEEIAASKKKLGKSDSLEFGEKTDEISDPSSNNNSMTSSGPNTPEKKVSKMQ